MPALGVELVLTFKCNWDCDYCLVDTHRQPERPFELVLADAHAIPPGTEVTLAGGETGMMSRDHLKEIIQILKDKNCPIDLLTNGLFIKSHAPMLEYVNEVFYHCVEYMTDDHVIEYPDLDQTKFLYILVATDADLTSGAIIRMMDRYPHIKFLVLPDTRPSHKITLNTFMAFMKEHGHRTHARTMEEFIVDIGRTWGDRAGIDPYGKIDKLRIHNVRSS